MRQAVKKNISPLSLPTGAESRADLGKPWLQLGGQGLTSEETTLFFSSLATLCGNGVPLPKAIGALAQEDSLSHRAEVLDSVRRRVETGELFSHVLSDCGGSFDPITVSQVRVGERSGRLVETLNTISHQRVASAKTRDAVAKKLAYPMVLFFFGVAVVAFLLTYVVPTFQDTYQKAGVELPGVTRALIAMGDLAQRYWWTPPFLAYLVVVLFRQLRSNEQWSLWIDLRLFRLPVVGSWLRDIALLQMIDALGRLMQSGYTLAEALNSAEDSVSNRAMKRGVADLRLAVQRGERFSREIEQNPELFPPMISQLVIVGEQTGKLTETTAHIRDLLQERIRRGADVAVGVIEPTLTITMAAAVAAVLLAIYLPMFDMVNTVGR